MSYFDLIREVRKGNPDILKAAKAMKLLGWICILGAIWNYTFYYLAPFEKIPFRLPSDYPYLALISLLPLGSLFILSARGIKTMEPWGKKLGQLAVIMLIGLIIISSLLMFFMKEFFVFRENVPTIFLIFSIIFIAQFAVPACFGIRYLGRLPVNEADNVRSGSQHPTLPQVAPEELGSERFGPQVKFKDSPAPFGIFGTLFLLIAILLCIIMIALKYMGPQAMSFIFFPMFLLAFIGPALYNRAQSPFEIERGRTFIASYTGGGSIFLFGGSWPFFRLLVYQDGVEIRVMFQRYFIPYDKMDDIPDKIGFFNRGILFKSNLADVPSDIRFQGFGMKTIVKVVNEMRSTYMAKERK